MLTEKERTITAATEKLAKMNEQEKERIAWFAYGYAAGKQTAQDAWTQKMQLEQKPA